MGKVPQRIVDNMDKYKKQHQQLSYILSDGDYYVNKGYRGFITDMVGAISGGRTITPKMESAIQKIISGYVTWRTDNEDPKRVEKIQHIEEKISKLKFMLSQSGYSKDYEESSNSFLDSVMSGVKRYGRITPKQKEALNKMYHRLEERTK